MLDKDNLKPLMAELFAKVDRLLEQVSAIRDQNKVLNTCVTELEGRKPPTTPTISSLPPSSGPKSTAPTSCTAAA